MTEKAPRVLVLGLERNYRGQAKTCISGMMRIHSLLKPASVWIRSDEAASLCWWSRCQSYCKEKCRIKISLLFIAESLPADPASRVSGIRKQKQCFSLYLETRDLYTFRTSCNLLSKNSWWLGDFNQEMKAAEVLLPQDRKAHLVSSLSLVCKANLKTEANLKMRFKKIQYILALENPNELFRSM